MALHGTRTVCKLNRCTKLCLLDSRPRRFAECRPPCLTWHEPDILSLIVLYFMHYPLCKPYLEIMRDHGGPRLNAGKGVQDFQLVAGNTGNAGRIYLTQIIRDKAFFIPLVNFFESLWKISFRIFSNLDESFSKIFISLLWISFLKFLNTLRISLDYKLYNYALQIYLFPFSEFLSLNFSILFSISLDYKLSNHNYALQIYLFPFSEFLSLNFSILFVYPLITNYTTTRYKYIYFPSLNFFP